MTTIPRRITGGVDHTPRRPRGGRPPTSEARCSVSERFPTTPAGYRGLVRWLSSLGTPELVGVEGTGSYGAGLTRHLHRDRIAVVEVDRPNRQRRRRKGESDPQDAVAAARAAQGGEANGLAKTRDGNVESMRVLRVARFGSAQPDPAINQMRSLVSTAAGRAPAPSSATSPSTRSSGSTTAYRHTGKTDVTTLTSFSLRTLARRAPRSRTRGQRDRPDLRNPGGRDGTGTQRHRRGGHRCGLGPSGGRRRQPRAPEERVDLRQALRRFSARRLERQTATPSPQPGRGSFRPTPPSGTSYSPGWSRTRGPVTTSSVG